MNEQPETQAQPAVPSPTLSPDAARARAILSTLRKWSNVVNKAPVRVRDTAIVLALGLAIFVHGPLITVVLIGLLAFIALLANFDLIEHWGQNRQLEPKEQAKLFLTSPRVQRSLYSIVAIWLTFSICQMCSPWELVTLWFQANNPLASLAAIPVAYTIALAISFFCGSRMLRSKQNADARRAATATQRWVDLSMAAFLLAMPLAVAAIAANPNGPVVWCINWLIASARDANLLSDTFSRPTIEVLSWGKRLLPSEEAQLVIYGQVFFGTLLAALLWTPAAAIGQFLTSFSRRFLVGTAPGEALLSAWREPGDSLAVKQTHSWIKNSLTTLTWLVVCYLILFWLCGFSQGPLASAIVNWLDCSFLDAGYRFTHSEVVQAAGKQFLVTTNKHLEQLPNLRIFIASIVALYGSGPLAISACVFLPYGKRGRIRIAKDGLILPASAFTGLASRFRLWSDLKSADLAENQKKSSHSKLVLKFFSGVKYTLRLDQLQPADLERLLAALDEHAEFCAVSESVLELRTKLKEGTSRNSIPIQDEFRALPADGFCSTVFVPYEIGQKLPANAETGETFRVVRQLASRPLAAVYLVRKSNGGLAIVKQFYLAEDTPQTNSVRKTFEREYALLSKLSHPRIAKVHSCYTAAESTFLVLDYFGGSDLRSLVREQGERPESLVKKWARELAELMIYLHGQEPVILHRDLTPDNIVISDTGHISLIDFGAAHQFLEHITGTMIGKKCYVAPEQLRGHAEPASDIYSFGCTLHFLLTGKDPKALSECSPALAVKVSREVDELVKACTQFEATGRPASFQDIINYLDGKAPLFAPLTIAPDELHKETLKAFDDALQSDAKDNSADVPAGQTQAEVPTQALTEGEEPEGELISLKQEVPLE